MTNTITSVSDYLEKLKTIAVDEDSQLFYRGVSNEEYATPENNIPSIYRKPGWIENEDKMFYELVSRVPEEFKDCQNTFEYLVKMQHYGYPTRLLDITSNPLVALYFACVGDEKENQKDGVVISFNINKKDTRNYESDRVLLLANLALSKRDITLTDFILNEMGNILDKFFKDKKALLTIAFPDDADTFREITELLLVLEGHFENLIQFEGKNDFAISLILAHLVIILKKTISYEKIDEYSELLDFNKLRLLKNRIRGYLIKQKFPIDDFAFLEVKGKLQDAFNEHFGLIRNYSKEYIKLRKSIDEYGRSLKEEKFYFNTSLIKLDDMYTPQCIIPKQNNPRIISQQGAFLVFGFSNHKDSILDPPIQEETKLARKMQKITIDENSKGEILKELYRLGVSASIMFPEIESVTKEIKDRYAKD